MIKKIGFLIILLTIGSVFPFIHSVQGQSDGFILTGEDAVNTFDASGSSELDKLLVDLQDRFILTYVNGKHVYNVTPFIQELTLFLQQVSDRFIIEHAQANKDIKLSFPAGMINDTTSPTASEVIHTILSPTSIKITWVTDEYATSIVAYGESSGIYPQSALDPLFTRNHALTLTDLKQNQSYFYRVSGVDRSGNSFESAEFSFNLGTTPIPTTPAPPPITPAPLPTTPAPPTVEVTPIPPSVTPTISEIRPNQGRADIVNTINLFGSSFAQNATVQLGTTTLAVTFVSATQLQADVPIGLFPGIYGVTVSNPNDGSATLANAYSVLGTDSDDLTGNAYELWVDPAAPHANASAKVGLVVHRQGGKQVLTNVVVHIYVGDPLAGGTFLGTDTIALLSPRSSATTAGVNWTPAGTGSYELYAIIDPSNTVAESDENNNMVHRTIAVLPPTVDTVAPHVDSFTINNGALDTTERVVSLNTTASDPAPGSVTALLFVEYEYSQGANQWIPAQSSEWLAYTTARTNYGWTLLPSIGMHYLQAWAVDSAGNISLFPYKTFVSFDPPTHRVGVAQVRIYRYTLKAGDQLLVRVEPSSGDPDLYVWAPDHATRPPWVSNLQTGTDDVSFVVPVDGIYQVEVYGFSAAEYQLMVDQSTVVAIAAQTSGGVDPTKGDLPSQPRIPLSSEPSARIALPPSGQTVTSLYLPFIRR